MVKPASLCVLSTLSAVQCNEAKAQLSVASVFARRQIDS